MEPRITVLLRNIKKIVNQCKSDVLYACKPLIASFGIGLVARAKYNVPLILDVDDWELSPFLLEDRIHRYISGVRYINRPVSYLVNSLFDKFIPAADLMTVSSRTLRDMYGGTIIPHVREIVLAKPTLRKNETIIMFLGTPRPHKGLDDLIKAFKMINEPRAVLKIVGMDYQDKENEPLVVAANSDSRILLNEMVPFDELNTHIAQADIIVIPQKDTVVGRTQVPAKIFDAMAQAKPVISTRISDIPEILGDAGIVVEPNDIVGLRSAIEYLLKNPRERMKLGNKAQERIDTHYNFHRTGEELSNLLTSYLNV
jgi:glycosyltransferase involved in cell wall biosynthesis